jgi:hypothetical protein
MLLVPKGAMTLTFPRELLAWQTIREEGSLRHSLIVENNVVFLFSCFGARGKQ